MHNNMPSPLSPWLAFGAQDLPAPPQGQAAPAPGPAPASGNTAQPSTAPEAQPEGPGGMGMLFMPILLVGMLVFMFWSTRSQQKKQEKQIDALKKGDRVVTSSGLTGKLVEKSEKYAWVEIAAGVKVKMLRSALAGHEASDVSKTADKDAKSKDAKSKDAKSKDDKGDDKKGKDK